MISGRVCKGEPFNSEPSSLVNKKAERKAIVLSSIFPLSSLSLLVVFVNVIFLQHLSLLFM